MIEELGCISTNIEFTVPYARLPNSQMLNRWLSEERGKQFECLPVEISRS